MAAPAIALKPAEEILQEAKEVKEEVKPEVKRRVLKTVKPEAVPKAKVTSTILQEKENDLKILQDKPMPTDKAEAKALKTAIKNLKSLITRMTGQLSVKPILFMSENIKEVEVGTGKGSKKILFNGQEVKPAKMTLVTMRKALDEVNKASDSKEKSRVKNKIIRAISDREKRDKATGNPDEVAAPKAPKASKKSK
jgi:nucleoside diphosphate kinase